MQRIQRNLRKMAKLQDQLDLVMNFIRNSLLVPHLNKMFRQTFDNGEFSYSMNETIVTFLLKVGGKSRRGGDHRSIPLTHSIYLMLYIIEGNPSRIF